MTVTFALPVAELLQIVSNYRKMWERSRDQFNKEIEILNRQNAIIKFILYGTTNIKNDINNPYLIDKILYKNPKTKLYIKENKPEHYEYILELCKHDDRIYVDYYTLTMLRSYKDNNDV